MNHVSDAELNWLYDHCKFTLYPSLYEGWGLPIVESFNHGKACIASNTSSMPEAGQGLAVHLDPMDFSAWYQQVLQFVDQPQRLADVESRIREHYQPRSWDEFNQEFFSYLDEVTFRLSSSASRRAA